MNFNAVPDPFAMVVVSARVGFEGQNVSATVAVHPELWESADFRKEIRLQLRHKIADAIAEKLDVEYETRLNGTPLFGP